MADPKEKPGDKRGRLGYAIPVVKSPRRPHCTPYYEGRFNDETLSDDYSEESTA